MPGIVTPADFKAALDALRGLGIPADPQLGFFGPGSASWHVLRASSVLFGGGRAGLLQLAHPTVAQAIDDHSAVAADIQGRLRRTLSMVYTVTFGHQRDALRLAGQVFAKHRAVVGEHAHDSAVAKAGAPYHANALEGLRWVGATLIDTSLLMFELTYGPLDPALRDRFVDEQRRMTALFGVPPDEAPRTFAEHRAYFDAVVADRLVVTPAGRRAGDLVMQPTSRLATPTFMLVRPVTAALMPPSLRAPFGLEYDAAAQAVARPALRLLRHVWPRAPLRLQRCPAWFHAQRRLAGREGPDPVSATLRDLALRALTG